MRNACAVEVCDRPACCGGYCKPHYGWMKRNGWQHPTHAIKDKPPTVEVCAVEVCGRRPAQHVHRPTGKRICRTHYNWSKTNGWAWPTHAIGTKTPRWKDKPCKVKGCDRMGYAHGMCQTHHSYWHRTGEVPTHVIKPNTLGATPRERIRAYSSIDPDTGCWEWTGTKNKAGYGKVYDPANDGKPRMEYAHRVSYREFVGPIPDGHHIDHLCRNHACCNPEHLEPVTHAENMRRGLTSVTSSIELEIPPLPLQEDQRGRPIIDRVLDRAVVDPDTGCWLWTGTLTAQGYGQVTGRLTAKGYRKTPATHRVVWEHLRGPIPEGYTIDHLCRVRACCNPDHLEPVTNEENSRRRAAAQRAIGVKPRIGREAA